MTMTVHADVSGLNRFRMALENVKPEEAIKAALKEAALTALRNVKMRTPVVTGTLKREWKVTSITREDNAWVIVLYNDTKYAPYVEYGHRQEPGRYIPALGKRLKKNWVPGQYIMKISCDEVQKNMGKIMEKHIAALFKR